jgi:hypothetical protein
MRRVTSTKQDFPPKASLVGWMTRHGQGMIGKVLAPPAVWVDNHLASGHRHLLQGALKNENFRSKSRREENFTAGIVLILPG